MRAPHTGHAALPSEDRAVVVVTDRADEYTWAVGPRRSTTRYAWQVRHRRTRGKRRRSAPTRRSAAGGECFIQSGIDSRHCTLELSGVRARM